MPIDAKILSKLPTLRLRARAVVEGVLAGMHKSPYQGQSVEFAEHKEYAPGDELRHLDWKAFGKLDRYYVKRFEHETELTAFLAIDASGSMNYRSAELSKLDVACTLAAALAQILVWQQDAVGLVLFRGADVRYVPPRSAAGHLQTIFDALEHLDGDGAIQSAQVARFLAEKARRRAAVFLFSDLFDEAPGGLEALLQLRLRKNDLALFHILDRDELTLPFDDPLRFQSMEGDGRFLEANPRELRASYLAEMRAFLDGVERRALESDSDYVRLTSEDALDRVLLQFLSRRDRSRR